MSISFAEPVPVTCPRCGTAFEAEIYIVIDAAERSDLVARILDDTLHDTICPNCGQAGRVAAPLLYHDASHARVLLAVPSDMPESEWQAIGQNLLWVLIGALPEEMRLPYLGEVQAEAGLAGIAQVIRDEGLRGSPDAEDVPPIVIAIQALLAASGPAELQRALDQHPILQEPQSVTILHELAAEAIKQRQVEAAEAFAHAADLLDQVKQLRAMGGGRTSPSDGRLSADRIESLAFMLLRSTTGQALTQAVDQHPELLQADVLDAVEQWGADQARQNKPRIAEGIAERLAALRDLRARYHAQQPVLDAVQAYLDADNNDVIEALIVEREELTTDAADQTLERLAQAARDDGDEPLAAFIAERRAFLGQVRAALGGLDHESSHE